MICNTNLRKDACYGAHILGGHYDSNFFLSKNEYLRLSLKDNDTYMFVTTINCIIRISDFILYKWTCWCWMFGLVLDEKKRKKQQLVLKINVITLIIINRFFSIFKSHDLDTRMLYDHYDPLTKYYLVNSRQTVCHKLLSKSLKKELFYIGIYSIYTSI